MAFNRPERYPPRMPKKSVQIGELFFSKQGDAENHFRAMLARYAIGVRIAEPDSTELYWLVERHPEASSKLGVGLDHFSVRMALYGQRCFEIVRRDGTKTDFSYKTCITGRAPSLESEALAALRAEAAEETKQLKWAFFRETREADGKVRCALSGRLLSLDEATIDHIPPNTFKSIALRFLAERNVDLSSGLVTPSKDNQYVPRLSDASFAADWREYYRKAAVVRIVAASRERVQD